MKIDKNERTKAIAIYSFLVLAGIVLLVFMLLNLQTLYSFLISVISILSPIIGGLLLSYMLNPLLTFFESKVFVIVAKKKEFSKLRRGLSIFCVMLCVLFVFYLIIMIILPQLTSSYKVFSENFSSVDDVVGAITGYVKNNEFFSKYYDSVLRILGIDPESGDSAIIEKAYELIKTVLPSIASFVGSVANGVYNTVIAFVFAVYLLAYRERMRALAKKLIMALLSEKHYNRFKYYFYITDYNFGSYIRNKLFDSSIVFLFSYFSYLLLGLKYYPILAIITGITNFVPFFGPIIGAVIVSFIVLITQPSKIIWTIAVIIIIQQLDGRIVGPMLLGKRFAIPSVWVITSTIVFGAIFGLSGMLFGVPLFATLYRIIGDTVNSKLDKKGLSYNMEDYYPEPENVESKGLSGRIASVFKKKKNTNGENGENN